MVATLKSRTGQGVATLKSRARQGVASFKGGAGIGVDLGICGDGGWCRLTDIYLYILFKSKKFVS